MIIFRRTSPRTFYIRESPAPRVYNLAVKVSERKKMGDLETHHKFLEIPCGRKLLRVLIFAIFPVFRKNNFLPKKIRKKKQLLQKFTPEYIWLRSTEKSYLSGMSVRVCNRLTKTSNLTWSTHTAVLFENKSFFPYCTYSIYKNENIIDD